MVAAVEFTWDDGGDCDHASGRGWAALDENGSRLDLVRKDIGAYMDLAEETGLTADIHSNRQS